MSLGRNLLACMNVTNSSSLLTMGGLVKLRTIFDSPSPYGPPCVSLEVGGERWKKIMQLISDENSLIDGTQKMKHYIAHSHSCL
jgi:hypothetical protein